MLVFLALWNLLVTFDLLPDQEMIEHLLWTLLFLKAYPKQKVLCSLCGGIDHDTVRKWIWQFISAICALEATVVSYIVLILHLLSQLTLLVMQQIVWENRFKLDKGNDCLVTVDGTDFRIAEHGRPFYSHKFKKSGLRYEVALCILTGDIVWINGPYECGKWPDIEIFRNSLVSQLAPNERVEADDGYIGEHPQHVKCPKGIANPFETEYMQQRARNRQETVNNCFKFWGALKQVWRNPIVLHGDAFRAIAIVTQVAINSGERLFEVGYRDPPWEKDGDDDDSI